MGIRIGALITKNKRSSYKRSYLKFFAMATS